MPTHGNLVYVAQWLGVNVHDAVEISMPPGIGTPHGPRALSCVWIWWVLTCQKPVHGIPYLSSSPHIPGIGRLPWDLLHNLHVIATMQNIWNAEINSHCSDSHLYLPCYQCCQLRLSCMRRSLNTRLW